MSTVISPNMQLPVPIVGVEPGQQFAIDVNNCMSLIDAHDHTAGSGVAITPNGLNINTDLPFGNNNLINARSLRMTAQSAPLALASDLGCLYVSGVDLYYNDENGNQVRITQSGGVAGSPGSISNLTSPASASYVAGSQTFVWQSDANTAANMDAGSLILRNITANSFGITLSPPSLGSNYTITLPALPASQKFMTIDNSGNMSAPWAVDNSTLEIASSTTLQIKDLGVITAKLADANVTMPKLFTRTINNPAQGTQNAIEVGTEGGTQPTSGSTPINLPTVPVTSSGRPLMIIIGPTNAGSTTGGGIVGGTSGMPDLRWRVTVDGTTVYSQRTLFQSSLNAQMVNFVCIAAAAAGAHVIGCNVVNLGSGSASIIDCGIIAYEMS